MITELIYPDADRPESLMNELKNSFAALPFVSGIYVFGSLARRDWDRWSDIDMLIITQTRSQFRDAFNVLCMQKVVLHRSPFLPQVEPSGGRVLGIVFEDESLFHCLDLNFLTMKEYEGPGAMDRFGSTLAVYSSANLPSIDFAEESCLPDEEAPEEAQISYGMHFTKKAVKKTLRGHPAHADLQRFSDHLKASMQEYPANFKVPGGEIGKIAQKYLMIADYLLRKQD